MKKSIAIVAGIALLIASAFGMYIGSISGAVDNSINDGRLSLSSTDPAPSSDITGSTIYWVPNGRGNRIALLDQAASPQAWTMVNVPSAVSLAVPSSSGVNYDVFGNLSSSALALSAVAWNTDTTRTTALDVQDGVKVKGQTTVTDSCVSFGSWNQLYSGSFTIEGQAFSLATAKTITGARFNLGKSGTPSGNVTVYLYACTGTPGSSGMPTGSAVATTGTIDISTLSMSGGWTEFTFTSPYTAAAGNYCVGIGYSGGNSSNYLTLGVVTPSSHAGNFFGYNGSFSYNASFDTEFQLIAQTTDSTAPAYRYLGTIRTSDILLDSQTTIASGITMYSGNNTVVGQAFAASTESMSGASFCLWKAGSPTGTAVAKLYACTGTPGTSGVPTGAALATSYQFDVSQLNVYSTWYPFNFITPYSGAAGNYCVTLEYSGGGGSNYIYVNDNTASHSGNEFYNNSGSNAANSSRDLCFKIYGYTTALSEDSAARRFIYNFYNQRPKQLKKLETAYSWTYQLATYEYFNANSANKIEFVLGDVGMPHVRCFGYNNNANTSIIIGIGLDGFSSNNLAVDSGHVTGASYSSHYAEMLRPIIPGYHYAAAIERAFTAGYSTTCFGTGGSGWPEQSAGLIGTIDQ